MEQPVGVSVVVVPYPAQGHLNQFLHFSLNLSSESHGLPLSIHYACSSIHIRQAKNRIQGWDADAVENIHFHELPLPPFPTPPPDPNATHKFPSHLLPAFEASMQLQAPLSSLLASLSTASRRLVLVYDPLMSLAGHVADSFHNAESYALRCTASCFNLSVSCQEKINSVIKPRQEVMDAICTPTEGRLPPEILEFVRCNTYDVAGLAGTLINTCREIEGEFIDLLAEEPLYRGKKFFAIGPLNPTVVQRARHECLEWLDKQPPASVVYVSFGSTSTFSDKQIEQLAMGLQRSKGRFVWALKDADRGDVFLDGDVCRQRELPPGFEREVAGMGIIVRGWAPQLEILAHSSTGAFLGHCGWNSCMESLSMGVPMIAWPLHSDQPRNAIVVTNYWKVGVSVRDWSRRDEVVAASEVEDAIKKVMTSDGAMEIRKKAQSMREVLRLAKTEGGSSRVDLDSFIAHITRE